MDRYIGLDAHASGCTLRVIGPSGKRLGSPVVETNAKALIELLRAMPGRRHLCLEEGTLASWLYEVLSPPMEEASGVPTPAVSRQARERAPDRASSAAP